jgi:hypothetical protein
MLDAPAYANTAALGLEREADGSPERRRYISIVSATTAAPTAVRMGGPGETDRGVEVGGVSPELRRSTDGGGGAGPP